MPIIKGDAKVSGRVLQDSPGGVILSSSPEKEYFSDIVWMFGTDPSQSYSESDMPFLVADQDEADIVATWVLQRFSAFMGGFDNDKYFDSNEDGYMNGFEFRASAAGFNPPASPSVPDVDPSSSPGTEKFRIMFGTDGLMLYGFECKPWSDSGAGFTTTAGWEVTSARNNLSLFTNSSNSPVKTFAFSDPMTDTAGDSSNVVAIPFPVKIALNK